MRRGVLSQKLFLRSFLFLSENENLVLYQIEDIFLLSINYRNSEVYRFNALELLFNSNTDCIRCILEDI